MTIKRGFVLILLVVICFTGQRSANAEGYEVQLPYNGYSLNGYEIEAVVNMDASLDITERITADFREAKHGIYRDLPMAGKMVVLRDGKLTEQRYLAKVTDITVRNAAASAIPYRKSTNGSTLRIQIGDPDQTLTGLQTYELHYHYALKTGECELLNGFSYNFIGTGWDTSISHIQFAIKLPSEADPEQIVFVSGPEGSRYKPKLEYSVVGDQLTGAVNEILDPGEGLTLQFGLLEKVIQPIKTETGYIQIIAFLAAAGISVAIWLVYGRRRGRRTQRRDHTPDLLNPAQMSYVLHGSVSNKALSAMILHWADIGFLKVSDEGKHVLRLIKQREPDESLPSHDQLMLDRLFDGRESVTASELGEDFYMAVREWMKAVAGEFQAADRSLVENSPLYAKIGGYLFSASIMTALVCQAMAYFSVGIGSILLTILLGILTWFAVLLGSFILGKCADRLRIRLPMAFIIWGMSSSLFLWLFARWTGEIMLNPLLYMTGSLAAGICSVAGAFSWRRTEYGSRLVKQVLEYKFYLKQLYGSKNKGHPPTEGNCYKDLPYVLLFGMSSKWAAALHRITDAEPPEWYLVQSGGGFEPMHYASYLSKSMDSFESSASPGDSSDGGSGSGAGGGGGGSW